MGLHKNATIAHGIHIPHSFEYADSAAREAATGFVASDTYKLALQLDNKSLWMLTQYTPTITWKSVDGSTSASTASELAFVPAGNLIATNTQEAIVELDTEKEPADGAIQTHITTISGNPHGVTVAEVGAIPTGDKGAVNGVCPLDASQKVAETYLPDSIVGQVEYQGTWQASINNPAIPAASAANKGFYYICSDGVASNHGYANVPAVDFTVGDWIISDGTGWSKVDNTDAVTTVFGRSGAIIAQVGDYSSFYEPIISTKNTAFNKNFGTAAGDVCQGNDARVNNYSMAGSYIGTPDASATIFFFVTDANINLPTNLVGSYFKVGTNPSGDVIFTINVNGSSIGTATINSSGVVTFATTSQSLSAGSTIEIVAPADLLTMVNLTWTLKGSLA